MTEKKTTKEYIRAVGRRKTSTASVRIYKAAKNSYLINGKDLTEYFPTGELRKIVTGAFEVASSSQKFEVVITVKGGGIHSQAEACRHGIARCLVTFDEELHTTLKKAKMLKRDPRQKERRKFGLKKARKAPQWSKR
ncbi:MAG: 30S ribosomal protein S9 [Candidatus Pacebacteria bacterium]|nr:30S ribosomal protein S9 [Candidatus Paceibacterota bacterium]